MPAIERLEISPSVATVAAGRLQQFSAIAILDDGSTEDVTQAVSWSSSLPLTASIDPAGVAHSHREGDVELVAELAGLTATGALRVTPAVVESIRVVPGERTLNTGLRQQYFAYALLSDGTERNVRASADWTSTDEEVAKVESLENAVTTKGMVTAVAAGTAEIAAELDGVQGRTSLAVAPSVIYGGGDMVSAVAYIGESWFNATNPSASRRLSDYRHPPDNGSLFAFPGSDPVVGYCQTGDLFSKRLFAGFTTDRVGDECGDYSALPEGFSGIPGRLLPDFVAAELPLDGEEYIRTQETVRQNPVQIPALAAAIAISYNNPEVTWPLNLTSAQLCDVFSGAVATWDQLLPNSGLSGKPIRIVFRGDHSAATFALFNHLSYMQEQGQCGGPRFNTSAWFTEATDTVPFDWIVAGSNAASGALVLATDGAIGYGEAADLALRHPDLKLADVNGIGPLARFQPPPIKVFPSECVIAGFGPARVEGPRVDGETPTLASCTGSFSYPGTTVQRPPAPPVSTPPGEFSGEAMTFADGRPVARRPDMQNTAYNPCALLANPDSYANPPHSYEDAYPSCPPEATDCPAPPLPAGYRVYPILSISYLLAYATANTDPPAVRKLMLAPYSGAALPPGFAALSGWAPTPELIEQCVGF